jgi:hypothetical protein
MGALADEVELLTIEVEGFCDVLNTLIDFSKEALILRSAHPPQIVQAVC